MKTFSFPFFLSICCMLFSISSSAQIRIPILNEATDQLLMERADIIINSELQLFQQGSSNQSEIIQSRSFQNDLPNQAIIIQNGIQNTLKIDQSTSNGVTLITQNGNNNNLDLLVDGENLKLTALQDGNNNEIKQTITQSANMDMNLIQEGNNHSIEQTFNNLNGLEKMTIIQKGQNAAIRVIHN
jgi:hypothetical protein